MILDKIAYGIGYAITTVVDEVRSIPDGFTSGVIAKSHIDDMAHTHEGESQDQEPIIESKPDLFSKAA